MYNDDNDYDDENNYNDYVIMVMTLIMMTIMMITIVGTDDKYVTDSNVDNAGLKMHDKRLE